MASFVTALTLLRLAFRTVSLHVPAFATVKAEFLLTGTLKIQMGVRPTHVANSSVLGRVGTGRFVVAKLMTAVALDCDIGIGSKVAGDLLLHDFFLRS